MCRAPSDRHERVTDESRQRGDPAVGTAQLVGHVLAQILEQRDLDPGLAVRDSLQIF